MFPLIGYSTGVRSFFLSFVSSTLLFNRLVTCALKGERHDNQYSNRMVNVISATGLYSSGHGRHHHIEDVGSRESPPQWLDYTGGIGAAVNVLVPPSYCSDAGVHNILFRWLFWKYRVAIIGRAPNVVFSLDFSRG